MKNYKKILAAALAMTMVAGSSVMAAAPAKSYVTPNDAVVTSPSDATGSITGGGQMEGNVSKDVFRVVVPSSIQGANAANFDGFNFVMDPQKLITATDAAKYKDASGGTSLADDFVEGKTLYFVNKTDRKLDNTSDYVLVTNKSSMNVEISLKAKMDQLGSITMSDTDEFAEDDDSASLYLAILGGSTEKAIDTTGVEVKGMIAKAKEGAYEIAYDGSVAGDYSYDLVNDDPSYFSSYEFALTGATNEYGDWSNVTAAPEVQFTWEVKPSADAAPTVQIANTKPAAGSDLSIPVSLGGGTLAATGITSITFVNNSGATKTMVKDTDYTFDGTTLVFKASHLAGVSAEREYTVTFNNTASTVVKIKVTP